jgi:hypothetical protein
MRWISEVPSEMVKLSGRGQCCSMAVSAIKGLTCTATRGH